MGILLLLLLAACGPTVEEMPEWLQDDVQVAPPPQQAALADGNVTAAEYHRAIERVTECLTAAGVTAWSEPQEPPLEGMPPGRTISLYFSPHDARRDGQPNEAEGEALYDVCYELHASPVVLVYDWQHTDLEP